MLATFRGGKEAKLGTEDKGRGEESWRMKPEQSASQGCNLLSYTGPHAHRASPVALVVKGLPAIAEVRDMDSIPGSRRSPGEGNGNPLQHSCLENPMDRGASKATVHIVAELDTTEITARTPCSQESSLVLMLCCCHLDIFTNFVGKLVFCK